MSGVLWENRIPVACGDCFSPSCRRCKYRRGCPYIYEQELRRAASQSRADARMLSQEADRLLTLVSRAGNPQELLELDWGLEKRLSQALEGELSLIASLRAQAGRSS